MLKGGGNLRARHTDVHVPPACEPASLRACAPASLTSPRKLPCVKKRRPTPRNDEMELVQVLIGQASRLCAWRSFPATSKRPQGIAEHWRALEWHWMALAGYWQALASICRYLAGIQQAFGRHLAGIGGQRCCLGVRAALDSSKDKIDERTVLPGLRRCRMTPLVFQGVVCAGRASPEPASLKMSCTLEQLCASHRWIPPAARGRDSPGSSTRIAPVPLQ